MPCSPTPRTHLRNPLAAILALAVFLMASTAGPAVAQTIPASGDWYTESQQLGFRVRTPKAWRFIPPNLGDPINLAKYVPEGRDWVPLKGSAQLFIWSWVLRFDLEAVKEARIAQLRKMLDLSGSDVIPAEAWENVGGPDVVLDEVIIDWLQESQRQGTGWVLGETSETRSGKRVIEERIYDGTMSWEGNAFPVRVYVALLPLGEGRWGAVAYNAPGEKAAWRKHESSFRRLARTLEPLELAAAAEEAAGPQSLRDVKRRELKAELQRMPEWWLHETNNYFILTDSRSKDFIEELGDRLEAIREIYAVDYPYSKARIYEKPGSTKKAKPDTADGDVEADVEDDAEEAEGAAEDEPAKGGTSAGRNSFELSRTSVVRVCSDVEMYHEYGGPYGSAGYWSPFHQELVVYDDQKGAGRADTWSVVNHEAFHQYIFYFYGNISPHSWYNEGTGDFYAGYEYNVRRKKFTLTPFDWRRSLARDNIRQKKFAPLKEFVRWTQGEYYGSNAYGIQGGENYALGWSFIWFLRTGKGKSKDWVPAWDGILDTYLAALARTGDLDEAIDEAFGSVDWKKLEEAWTSYGG